MHMNRLTLCYLLLGVVVLGPLFAEAALMDPCAAPVAAARGDAFPIGLALIPGANASLISQLITAGNNQVGLCNKTLQAALVNYYDARIAYFNLALDRLQVLRLPFPDIIFPLVNVTTTRKLPPTMVAVAFRTNINSDPVYLANGGNNTQIYGAGFVISLALLVKMDKGFLQYLQWYDLTCNSCGGLTSQVCLHQLSGVTACATPFVNCTCIGQASNCSYTDSQFDQCSTAINVGFSGTDSHDSAFRTGPQIQRLNQFSLVSLYYKAKQAVQQSYDNIYSNLAGQWSSASQDAAAQQVSFGGGFAGGSNNPVATGTPPPSPPPLPPSPFPSPPSPPPSPPSPPFNANG